MLSAKDVMTRNPIAVHPTDTIVEAAHILLRHSISGLPVVDEAQRVVGIITEYELLDLVRDPNSAHELVAKHMSAPAWTVAVNESVDRVIDLMRQRHIRRTPVVDDGRLVGVIARRDLLRAGCALIGRRQQQQWLSTLLGT